MYEPCYLYRCKIYFLCGFLLARPLLFKTEPGTCSSVVTKIIFLKVNLCLREKGLSYNSGGSITITREGAVNRISYLSSAACFIPPHLVAAVRLDFISERLPGPSHQAVSD